MQQGRRQNKEEISRPQPDIVRQLRGISFIEPNDEEFKPTMNAGRRKLEVPMPPSLLCKVPIKSSVNPHQYWETQFQIRLCCWWRRKHETKARRSWTVLIQRQQWRKNWKIGENSGMAVDKVRKRERSDQGARTKAEKFILRHDGSLSSLRIRSWNLNSRNTKSVSYSEVKLWKMILVRMQCALNKDHERLKWRPPKTRT